MAIIADNNTSIANRQPFLKINNIFLLDPRTQKLGSALTTYLNLRTFSDSKAKPCFPAIKTLAKMQGCSPNTVTNHLNKLVKSGFIRIEHRMNQSNIYHFLIEQELLGKTEQFNISKEFPKAAMTTSKRRWERKPPTPPEIFDTPPKNFAHPPQEFCDLTRTTEPDFNNQTQKPISKTRTEPEPGNSITPMIIDTPISKAPISVFDKKEIIINPEPQLELRPFIEYFKDKINYKLINQELLSMVSDDFKDRVKAILVAMFKHGEKMLFYPKAVVNEVRRQAGKIYNKSSWIWHALSDPESYKQLQTDAKYSYETCLDKWRSECARRRTKYEFDYENWKMANNKTPIRSFYEGYKQLRIKNNQPIDSDIIFSREGKTFDTPKPRGMSNEEWCTLCGFEFDKWLAHKHAKDDFEIGELIKKHHEEMLEKNSRKNIDKKRRKK